VLLIPAVELVPTPGVLKPAGGLVAAANDRLGVTLIPPGCPR